MLGSARFVPRIIVTVQLDHTNTPVLLLLCAQKRAQTQQLQCTDRRSPKFHSRLPRQATTPLGDQQVLSVDLFPPR